MSKGLAYKCSSIPSVNLSCQHISKKANTVSRNVKFKMKNRQSRMRSRYQFTKLNVKAIDQLLVCVFENPTLSKQKFGKKVSGHFNQSNYRSTFMCINY